MKSKHVLSGLSILISLCIFTTAAFSSTGASILSFETEFDDGWWEYRYTIENTSDDASMYMFLVDFGQSVTVKDLKLPSSWYSVIWDNTETNFLHFMSFDPDVYIHAGLSRNDYSFKANARLGDFSYHAEFINASSIKGTTLNSAPPPAAPEPVSTVLFLTGGATMALRFRQKRKKSLT